jgi:hypothetical protein
MYIDEKLIKILEPHRGETIDVSYAISLIKTIAEEYETEHKGVIKKRAKSKFECLLTKQEIEKRLGV